MRRDRSRTPLPEESDRVPYYFPFIWRDWCRDADVKKMSPSDKGIYVELLIEQWMLDVLPGDLMELGHITRSRVDVMKQWLMKWGHRVLICALCSEAINEQDMRRICEGDVEEVWKRCDGDVAEMEVRCRRHGTQLKNRKLEFLRKDVNFGLAPGTTKPNLTEPKGTEPTFPAPRGATEAMPKPLRSVSVSSDEEFLQLPLEKAQAYADPNCTICLGDGTYGKGTQLVRCDCSRSQSGGGG
jgi:hypothetical protein